MTMDGGDQPIRPSAHAFARELLGPLSPARWCWSTTREFDRGLRSASPADRAEGRKKRRDAAALDAVAAAVIVERWLAAPHDALRIEETQPNHGAAE
jgi:putative Holliday junction resolvase